MWRVAGLLTSSLFQRIRNLKPCFNHSVAWRSSGALEPFNSPGRTQKPSEKCRERSPDKACSLQGLQPAGLAACRARAGEKPECTREYMRILSPCRVQPLQGATREQRKNAKRRLYQAHLPAVCLPVGRAVFKAASH
jgi:hypothetical protein